jgi:hypothetical protein
MPTTLKFEIPAPNIKDMKVKIEGTMPLIFHRWSEKAKQMILDKQMKKATKGREVKNPEQDAEDSYYKDSSGKIAFPALCIKQAMVNAVRNVEGVTMTLLRGSVFVVGDKEGLIPVEYKKKSMRSDMVRVGMGTADIRFRGQVEDWSMTFIIKFNADVVSAEQVLNLLNIAGFSCGLGEWRPERNGDFGTFQVSQ